jgi:hypothetical protein
MAAKGPPLPELLSQLRTQAERSGQDRGITLSHGARVAWRVKDGGIVFSIARAEKPLGDQEINVFRGAAGVPTSAERVPAEGQKQSKATDGAVWYRVAWKWTQQGETPQ